MYEIWHSGAFHNNENLTTTTFPVEEYHIVHMLSGRQYSVYTVDYCHLQILQILSIHNL